jgi:hypothetical protein
MPDSEKLKAESHEDMLDLLVSEREAGLCSTRFRQMIDEHGAIEAAHRLLKPDRELPPIFEHLRGLRRTDLTMESYVLRDRYKTLFSEQEREIARWRLQHGD